MPNDLLPIPDWFSQGNDGAGIAVAERGGDRDLVVLMVDDGPQQNRGLYRLGRGLGEDGTVTGGWTPWIDVPDWFSWANQDADVAVADIGGGDRDLVVLMVDDGPEQNRGLYRIGRGLDVDGAVTGGWTPWIDVPGWFSWDNEGAGVAVTPPDAQGRRDLVVFMIDAGPGVNRGVYRIGRDLQRDGTPSGGWTDWIDVPGWFSWANQGAGVAVGDLDGTGARDLLLMQVDAAPTLGPGTGKNEAFFRVAADLDAAGLPAAWGPDWLGVPHWFSHENAGAGVALARLGGATRLLALLVDETPAGPNAGLYRVMDLRQDPGIYGSWEVKSFLSGVLAVHAALLPGGNVLFFAGSGSSRVRFDSQDFGDVAEGVPISAVWNPSDDGFSFPPTLRAADGRPFDLFCGGDALLPDGRLLSAGGTRGYGPFTGRDDAAVLDPRTETWSFVQPMAHGRWYPTLITLGDGRVLATTGLDEHGGGGSRAVMEVYSAGDDRWEEVAFPEGLFGLPLYAHLFLLADGRIFFSGGRMDDDLDVQPGVFEIGRAPVAFEEVPDLLDPELRNQSASVLLPPAQEQRVMVCGGGPEGKQDRSHATDRVSIVDLAAADPSYAEATPMALGRMHLNAVLLPDHTVLVSGGALKQEDEPLARRQSELYDPATDTWRLMATATVPRLYHSTALLLPDGRVVAAGGNPEGGGSVPFAPPDPDEEMRVEIFSPPYLFRGPRPVITAAPGRCGYAETITIASAQAGAIRSASLIRGGVTTHSFDAGQRLVDLDIVSRTQDRLSARVTDNPNLAPPGWYPCSSSSTTTASPRWRGGCRWA